MAQSKEEIIRYVNEWVAQMKQKKHANTGQDFAEITVEEDHTAPVQEPARSAGEGNPPPLFKNAPPLAQHLVF